MVPNPLDLRDTGGLSLALWISFSDRASGQTILDTRDEQGRGFVLSTTDIATVRIDLNDGRTKASWACDPGLLEPDKLHHVVAIVDAGPRIITFVVDGVLCDGGAHRQFGWGRYRGEIGDVSGARRLRIAPSVKGELKRLRIYARYLRTSEAVANSHAGP